MGKAGFALTNSLLKYKIAVNGCFSRNSAAVPVVCFSNFNKFFEHLKTLGTQVLFITTRDDQLKSIAKAIAIQANLPKIVCYLSGSQELSVFQEISSKISVAMFHPLSVLHKDAPINAGTMLTICSNSAHTNDILLNLAKQIELNPMIIKDGFQPLYHAAAAITANLSLGLLNQSLKLFEQAGIDKTVGQNALANLLKTSANAAINKSLPDALTGPVTRGDLNTIKKHINALKNSAENNTLKTYRLLSNELSELIK